MDYRILTPRTLAILANYKITLALRPLPTDLLRPPYGDINRHLRHSATRVHDGLSVFILRFQGSNTTTL